jgi:hypothetical protein
VFVCGPPTSLICHNWKRVCILSLSLFLRGLCSLFLSGIKRFMHSSFVLSHKLPAVCARMRCVRFLIFNFFYCLLTRDFLPWVYNGLENTIHAWISTLVNEWGSCASICTEILGPDGTVYANGIFKLQVRVPDRYSLAAC